MAVDLGDVTLGIVANTKGLEAAVSKLRAFGQEVNRLNRMSGEGAQAAARAYSNQERVLVSLLNRLNQQAAVLKKLEQTPEVTDQLARNTKAYNSLFDTMSKGEQDTTRLARAREYANRVVQQSSQAIARFKQEQTALMTQEQREAQVEEQLDKQFAQRGIANDAAYQKQRAQNQMIMQQAARKAAADTAAAEKQALQEIANEEKRLGVSRRQERARDAALAKQAAAEESRLRKESATEEKQDAVFARQARARTAELAKQQAREVAYVQKQAREQARVQQQQDILEARKNAALSTAQSRVAVFNQRAEDLRGGNATPYIMANTRALADYETQMRTNVRTTAQLMNAKTQFNSVLSANQVALRASATTAEKMSLAMRELERAAILAYGPLSGVGARLAVLSALFDTSSVKSVLAIAGIVGAGVALYKMAEHSIKASMEFEKYNAQMLVATGSAITVGDRMEYVIGFTQKMGQSIEAVIPAYTRFAASARLAGVSLKDQKALFEASLKAATAMRMTGDEVGHMFLAFEQMASKGQVMTEELKRQLGNVLPGAMEMGAIAMGMSLSKFMNALKNGEIQFRDFAGKYAALMDQIFGPAAEKGSQSTFAALNRLSNTWKLFALEFDRITTSSKLFKGAVEIITGALEYLRQHLSNILAAIGAAAAAFGSWVAIGSLMAAIVPVVSAVTTGFYALYSAVLKVAQGMAILDAVGSRSWVGLLIRAGISLAATVYSFNLLKDAFDDASRASKSNIDVVEDQIKAWKKLGTITRETAEEAKKAMVVQMETLNLSMMTAQEQLTLLNRAPPDLTFLEKLEDFGNRMGAALARSQGFPAQDPAPVQSKALAARKAELQKFIDDTRAMVERYKVALADLLKIKVTDPDTSKDLDKSVANFQEKIRKMVEDYKAARAEFEAVQSGATTEDLQRIKAVADAAKLIEDAGKVKGFDLSYIITQFEKVGITAEGSGNKVDKAKRVLTQAMLEIARASKQTQAMISFNTNAPEKVQELNDALSELKIRTDESGNEFSAYTSKLTQDASKLNDIAKMARSMWKELLATGAVSPDFVNRWVEAIKKQVQAIQNTNMADWIHNQLVTMGREFDTEAERISTKWRQEIGKINQLKLNPNISTADLEKANALLTEMNKKWAQELRGSYLKEYFSDLTRAVEDWRDKTADAFTEMLVHGKFTFKALFDSIMMDITKMIVKRQITDPLYKILFGDLGGSKNPNDRGIFGGALEGILGGKGNAKAQEQQQTAEDTWAAGIAKGIRSFFGMSDVAAQAKAQAQTTAEEIWAGADVAKASKTLQDGFNIAFDTGCTSFDGVLNKGVTSFGGIFDSLTSGIRAVFEWFISAFSAASQTSSMTGGGGGLIGGALSKIGGLFDFYKGGGWGTGNAYGNMDLGGFFAEGGDVMANRPIWVGEKGPEVFVPKSSGTIIPNDQATGGTQKVQNITINVSVPAGTSRQSAFQIGAQVARQMQIANKRFN